ncbi:gamma-glutamylcyclotransferase family protein [Vannielia sp.]|uniref:gamma-glutamylcyclotransferase family protein n=1 Tax=Vannielia sp. TaxID=2813045 RepID=UPI0026077C25|nr:gamma-glutamylcyclotransferase family protein [Vannielia sp.]MDF1873317.1 gamma-glutamylcyclotransferase [Vannielia sp.]
MENAYFFGYGSLVNRATHSHVPAFPALLHGWRRVWKSTVLRPVAFLSAEPFDGAQIEGLIAHVQGGDWAQLDIRERAYARHEVTARCDHEANDDARIEVYAVPHHMGAGPDVTHPILLSYVDTVVQGFAEVFGEAGAMRFFETTQGWGGPVLDDRAAPIYPRATDVSASERAFVDAALERLGVVAERGEITEKPPATPQGGGTAG